jgi:hypothetical protein
MAGTAPRAMELAIGSRVDCTDQAACGELTRVVVDPVAGAVTHVVVSPKHGPRVGRLVPLDLVDTGSGTVRLCCSAAGLDALAPAEETEFLPALDGYGHYPPEHVLTWPYYGLGIGTGMVPDADVFPRAVTRDRLPFGEVAVRRGERVHACDGDIGRVQGLVVDGAGHLVTHVLLQEGHLWGRKHVAIPIGAVVDVQDGIRLSLTKQEVADLPPVELETPAGLESPVG